MHAASGRLRPLYKIKLSYDGDGRVSFEDGYTVNSSPFSPSIFDIVLSPQQTHIREQILSTTTLTSDKFNSAGESRQGTKPTVKVQLTFPANYYANHFFQMVFVQGSAGNGKTTCLLTSALGRAAQGTVVNMVCATAHLAESIRNDLTGSDSEALRNTNIQVLDDVKNEIRRWVGKFTADLEITKEETLQWIRSVAQAPAASMKLKEGEEDALAEWLVKGSKESSTTDAYAEYKNRYANWKKSQPGRFDEGDVWLEALTRCRSDEQTSLPTCHCDMLIVDEAQLYPADSLFELLLIWYHPSQCILVGMDTKQAIYLGCSKRSELYAAAKRACYVVGWSNVEESRNNLTTNFRLPAKMIALSNSLVTILRVAVLLFVSF